MERRGDLPRRKYPAKGVLIVPDTPTVVFATICTAQRRPWLATEECHVALRCAWKAADAWLVGRYVIMPDHIHLFAAPAARDIDIERWVQYWKAMVTRTIRERAGGWQRRCWHHRLRRTESYVEKWEYVAHNPVRKGLVAKAEDWPFQGEMSVLSW